MSTRNTLYAFLAATILAAGCSKRESAQPIDPGHEYFPIRVGSWVEYQVDSAWRDDAFSVDTSKSYLLRQVIAEHYTDPGGRPALRIERFIRQGDEWVIRDVWTGTRSTTGLEVTEENERRLKLSFPVRDGRTWDVNALNTMDRLEVITRNAGQPITLGGTAYARTVLVESTVPGNIVETRDYRERYAEGVGMIEHHWYHRQAGGSLRSVQFDMVAVAYGN
jgi:hypothetical protein